MTADFARSQEPGEIRVTFTVEVPQRQNMRSEKPKSVRLRDLDALKHLRPKKGGLTGQAELRF